MIQNKIKAIVIMAILIFITLYETKAQCLNGNLESGNLSGWNFWYTAAYATPNNVMTPGITTINATSHRNTAELEPTSPLAFNDYIVGSQLLKVFEGNGALRLGDLNVGTAVNSSMGAYTFTVTNANKDFKFWYALEMSLGTHPIEEQPDFTWFMKLGAGTLANSSIPTSSTDPSYSIYQLTKYNRALPENPSTDPWWLPGIPISGPTNLWIRRWTCQRYDLTPFVGQQVTIYFRIRDCVANFHYAYAYIDGLCYNQPLVSSFTLPTTACWNPETPIILDGTASQNEDSYQIGIVQQFPAGTPLGTILATAYTETFFGSATTHDIRQLYRDANGVTRFKCGATYNVTLTTNNSCGGTAGSLTKQITFACPMISPTDDKTVCCGQSVTLGFPRTLYPNTYSWSPIPAGATLSGASQMTFTPTTNVTYTVTATDVNGCKNFDETKITVKKDFVVTISENCPPDNSYDNWLMACNQTLTANVQEISCNGGALSPITTSDYTFTWTINGQTFSGKTISKPPYDPNYGTQVKLEVSNGCYSKTVFYNITCKKFIGEFTPVIMANSVWPASSIYENSILRISQFGTLPNYYLGAPAAYNAWGYRLMVWHRWGTNLVYDSDTVINYNGINQGDILWDPANDLQLGDYVYTLDLFNCTYPNGRRVKWAVGKYCNDPGSNGDYHTMPWPPECWFYPVCCDDLVNSTVPTNNSAGIYMVQVLY